MDFLTDIFFIHFSYYTVHIQILQTFSIIPLAINRFPKQTFLSLHSLPLLFSIFSTFLSIYSIFSLHLWTCLWVARWRWRTMSPARTSVLQFMYNNILRKNHREKDFYTKLMFNWLTFMPLLNALNTFVFLIFIFCFGSVWNQFVYIDFNEKPMFAHQICTN